MKEKDIFWSLCKIDGVELPDLDLDFWQRKILRFEILFEVLIGILLRRNMTTQEEIGEIVAERSLMTANLDRMKSLLFAQFILPYEEQGDKPHGKEENGKETNRSDKDPQGEEADKQS